MKWEREPVFWGAITNSRASFARVFYRAFVEHVFNIIAHGRGGARSCTQTTETSARQQDTKQQNKNHQQHARFQDFEIGEGCCIHTLLPLSQSTIAHDPHTSSQMSPPYALCSALLSPLAKIQQQKRKEEKTKREEYNNNNWSVRLGSVSRHSNGLKKEECDFERGRFEREREETSSPEGGVENSTSATYKSASKSSFGPRWWGREVWTNSSPSSKSIVVFQDGAAVRVVDASFRFSHHKSQGLIGVRISMMSSTCLIPAQLHCCIEAHIWSSVHYDCSATMARYIINSTYYND